MAIEVVLIDTETGQRQTAAMVEPGDTATVEVVCPPAGRPASPRCTKHQVDGVLTPVFDCPACQGAPTEPSVKPDHASLVAIARYVSREWANARARQGGVGGRLNTALDALDELLDDTRKESSRG